MERERKTQVEVEVVGYMCIERERGKGKSPKNLALAHGVLKWTCQRWWQAQQYVHHWAGMRVPMSLSLRYYLQFQPASAHAPPFPPFLCFHTLTLTFSLPSSQFPPRSSFSLSHTNNLLSFLILWISHSCHHALQIISHKWLLSLYPLLHWHA